MVTPAFDPNQPYTSQNKTDLAAVQADNQLPALKEAWEDSTQNVASPADMYRHIASGDVNSTVNDVGSLLNYIPAVANTAAVVGDSMVPEFVQNGLAMGGHKFKPFSMANEVLGAAAPEMLGYYTPHIAAPALNSAEDIFSGARAARIVEETQGRSKYGSGGVEDDGAIAQPTAPPPAASEGLGAPAGATDIEYDSSTGKVLSYKDPDTGRLTVNIEGPEQPIKPVSDDEAIEAARNIVPTYSDDTDVASERRQAERRQLNTEVLADPRQGDRRVAEPPSLPPEAATPAEEPPEFGSNETIDFGPKGIQPVTVLSTEDLQNRLAAEGKTNPVINPETPDTAVATSPPAPPEQAPTVETETPKPSSPPQEPVVESPHPADDVTERLTKALEGAGKAREDQEALYTQERSDRLKKVAEARRNNTGEASLHAELAQLKGEMPKADFESVRDQFSQEDIDHMMDKVKSSSLPYYDSIRARVGLTKLLAGEIPTASELKLMSEVFPPDFIKAAVKHKDFLRASSGQGEMFSGTDITSTGPIKTLLPEAKATDPDKFVVPKGQLDLFREEERKPSPPTTKGHTDVGPVAWTNNVMRGLMASMDMSGLFNQGSVLAGRKSFWTSIPTMIKSFGSQGFYDGAMRSILTDPLFEKSQDAGLFFARPEAGMNAHEEAFMAALGKIPVLGKGYKGAERAYTGLLNKMRFDSFKNIVNAYDAAGTKLTPEDVKSMASFINSATGRGDLGRFGSSGPVLSGLLFAPRFLKSRVDLLNPMFYARMTPVARKYAAGTMARYAAGVITILGVAKAGGAQVELDPRSNDFAKIKVGDTRYSPLGAFQPLVRLTSQVVTRKMKSSDGSIQDLTEGKFGQPTRLSKIDDFGRSKLGPLPGFVADWAAGKDLGGNQFSWGSAVGQRVTPLWMQDVYDSMQDHGAIKGAAMGAPSFFGVPMNTYGKHTGSGSSSSSGAPAFDISKPFTTSEAAPAISATSTSAAPAFDPTKPFTDTPAFDPSKPFTTSNQ